jgi:hypothetical protein
MQQVQREWRGDHQQGRYGAFNPPPGGCSLAVMELAPGGNDFDEFVRTALAPWADHDEPEMRRTATMDYDIVLDGIIGLELDNGVKSRSN